MSPFLAISQFFIFCCTGATYVFLFFHNSFPPGYSLIFVFFCIFTPPFSNLGGYVLTTKDGKIAYYKESEGADSAVPFSSGASKITITVQLSLDGGSGTTPSIVSGTFVYKKQSDGKWMCKTNSSKISPWAYNSWRNSGTVYGAVRISSIIVE